MGMHVRIKDFKIKKKKKNKYVSLGLGGDNILSKGASWSLKLPLGPLRLSTGGPADGPSVMLPVKLRGDLYPGKGESEPSPRQHIKKQQTLLCQQGSI